MKRFLALPVLLLAALALAAAGSAHDGKGEHGKRGHHHWHHHGKNVWVLGPYEMTSTDNGSCGVPWAQDTFKRWWVVKAKRNGTYRVARFDAGRFTTTGPASPGACETTKPHGTVVLAGIQGRFFGKLRGNVSGGTFNPSAACTTDCGATDVFIPTHFGTGATFSCNTNSTKCAFGFHYFSKDQRLALHHWVDAGRGAGSSLNERLRGDISTDRVS
jgi:hypothetical protein